MCNSIEKKDDEKFYDKYKSVQKVDHNKTNLNSIMKNKEKERNVINQPLRHFWDLVLVCFFINN